MKKKNIAFSLVAAVLFLVVLNVNAISTNEYTIDYLIKNYSIVTLGMKDNNLESKYRSRIPNTNKGDIIGAKSIEGPTLKASDPSSGVERDKLYAAIVNEQKWLVETATMINSPEITVNAPGSYTITNTSIIDNEIRYYVSSDNYRCEKNIFIDHYNPHEYYVFNIMDTFVNLDYYVNTRDSGDTYSSIYSMIEDGVYTGNIIFNFPNARYIETTFIEGKFIAPKADVNIILSEALENGPDGMAIYTGERTPVLDSVIANSVTINDAAVEYHPSTVGKKVVEEPLRQYTLETEDYNDDLFTGNYSLVELLKNYNVVTFGKKNYELNTRLQQLGYRNGSAAIFHIDGQFLVNGDLGAEGENYPGSMWGFGWREALDFDEKTDEVPTSIPDNLMLKNMMRLDLDSNEITESYLNGEFKTPFYINNWESGTNLFGSKNSLYNKFISKTTEYERIVSDPEDRAHFTELYFYSKNEQGNYLEGLMKSDSNYINMDRLYDNIVEEQAHISDGLKLTATNGVIHIPVGGRYVIDDVNGVNEIIFDKFSDNKDNLTLVTIKNSGSFNFPVLKSDNGGLIFTNDYYGKTIATHDYEYDRSFQENYHGNIIWNVPNAVHINLAPNAPFVGHLVAPKADVETVETQVAGAIVANSFYASGSSEAHFYPLSINRVAIDNNGPTYTRFAGSDPLRSIPVEELLGGEYTKLNRTVVGDKVQYDKDMSDREKNTPGTNPWTYRNLGLLLIALLATVIGITVSRKKKSSSI